MSREAPNEDSELRTVAKRVSPVRLGWRGLHLTLVDEGTLDLHGALEDERVIGVSAPGTMIGQATWGLLGSG